MGYEGLHEYEIRQGRWTLVLSIQKVPLQDFLSDAAESGLELYAAFRFPIS